MGTFLYSKDAAADTMRATCTAIHSMQMKLQQHQHCIALLSHKESGALQHHTAVNSCSQIPVPLHCSVTDRAQHAADGHQQHCCQKLFTKSGPLHCRVTDTAQHASHSMQQEGTSSIISTVQHCCHMETVVHHSIRLLSTAAYRFQSHCIAV